MLAMGIGVGGAGGGAATPAGSNTQIQFNNSGAFGASSNFTFTAPASVVIGAVGLQQGTLFLVTGGGTSVSIAGSATAGVATVSGPIQPTAYQTATNCSSAAAPAVCGSAASGSVVVAAAATTVVVNTTAITANSQVQLTFDSSLGTKLGVTCNTTVVQPTVSARTGGTSFTITVPTAPTTNPACFSYTIIN